jgi:hypothetical protein
MRRFLLKSSCFAALTTVVFWGVNELALKAGRIYKDGAALICEAKREQVRSGEVRYQPGKLNVLFMGNSRILAGVVPPRFDELAAGRTSTWNLALPASPIAMHYFVLRDYLERNPPPEHIVLALSVNYGQLTGWYDQRGRFPYYAAQGLAPGEAASFFVHRPDKSVVQNYLFPVRLYGDQLQRYLREWLLAPQTIGELKQRNTQQISQVLADRGYYYIREQARFDGRLPDDFSAGRPPARFAREANRREVELARDPYVKMFFDLALERGIKVLMVEPPVRAVLDERRKSCPSHYRQLLSRYSNVAMSPEGWRQKLYPNRYFADTIHLNPDGAEAYTQEVWGEFAQVYLGVPSAQPASAPAEGE